MNLDAYLVAIIVAIVLAVVLHLQASSMPFIYAERARMYRNYGNVLILIAVGIAVYHYYLKDSLRMNGQMRHGGYLRRGHMCGMHMDE